MQENLMLKKLCAGLVIFSLIPQAFADLTARQRVFRLAHDGNVEAIKQMANLGEDINDVDSKGKTALCTAVVLRDVRAYNTLIAAGADQKAACMDKLTMEQKQSFCGLTGATRTALCSGNLTSEALSSGFLLNTAGAVLLGGGAIAIAAGGGGGGGGGDTPAECSGHGHKDEAGACICDDGWRGIDCETSTICDNVDCGTHGSCDMNTGLCVCESGWKGDSCETETACELINCGEHGTCSGGSCSCSPGYSGDDCSIEDLCYNVNCGAHGTCEKTTGTCICSDDYTGEFCDKAPATTVPETKSIAVDDSSVCTTGKIINGMCMVDRLSDDGDTPISLTPTDSGLPTGVHYLAEYGGNVNNTVATSVSGDTSTKQVGMWANGVGKSAVSTGGGALDLAYASKATNSSSLTMTETTMADKGVIGMHATSGGSLENNGTITITALSNNPSAAMDASKITDKVNNRGANITNSGTINLNASGKAYNVKGINAPNRTVLAHTTSEMNIVVGENGWTAADSDKRGLITGMSGNLVVNRGNISVKADENVALGKTAQTDIRVLEASSNGNAYNDASGKISIDLTNLRYNVSGIYSTPGTAGTTAVNKGTIDVTGKLYNDPNIANHVYVLGSGAGSKATLLNEGDVTVNVDATNGGILHVMDEMDGTATNNRNISITVSNEDSDLNAFDISAMSMTSGTMTNKGLIEVSLTGQTKSSSVFAAMDSYGSAVTDMVNEGTIKINTDMDNTNVSAFRGRGTLHNNANGRIEITSTADNVMIETARHPDSGKGTLHSKNAGTVIVTQTGGSGAIQAWGGGNTGKIYMNIHDMTESVLPPIIVGVGLASGGAEEDDSQGLLDMQLTGKTYGEVVGWGTEGDMTRSNTINISAQNSERVGDLEITAFLHESGTLTRAGATTINVTGSADKSTHVTGLLAKNSNITHSGVLTINADLTQKNSDHLIIGMRSWDSNVDTKVYQEGHKVYSAINNGTISIDAHGKHVDSNPFDVIGMLTNSYAENNGTIEITVSGGLKAVGMMAYRGGYIVNHDTIRFNLNDTASTFVPFYAAGSRDEYLGYGADKDGKKYITQWGTSYATIYNDGSIIVSSKTETGDAGVKNESGNYYYNDGWARRIYTLQDFSESEEAAGKEDYFLLTTDTPDAWSSNSATDEPDYPTVFYGKGDGDPGYANQAPAYQKNFDISKTIKYVTAKKGVLMASGMHMTGDVTADPSLVTGGNLDFYLGNGQGEGALISDGSYADLTVESGSALFSAAYQNNTINPDGIDIALTRRSFDDVIEDKALANYLEANYTAGNAEAFFDTLKGFEDKASLTAGLDKAFGRDMLSRFAFEDMTLMRELNLDMNNRLFNNTESYFSTGATVASPIAFKNDSGSKSRYSLANRRSGDWSVGLGIAFTNTRSDDNHNSARSDSMYQMIVPIGYRTGRLQLVTSPRLGYARGTYDRVGLDNRTYDGTIEKRIFGLMNEARYPMTFGQWQLAPAVEFNALGYEQRGSEDAKAFRLNIPRQRTYSIESGFGVYATHESDLSRRTHLKLTAGLTAYHEFADPYRMTVGLEGLSGRMTLRDEDRSDNRAVARAGFTFDRGNYSLNGHIASYIDREIRTKANLALKFLF